MHCICDHVDVCEFDGSTKHNNRIRILFTVNVVAMLRRANTVWNKEINANAHIQKCFGVICAPFGWQHVMLGCNAFEYYMQWKYRIQIYMISNAKKTNKINFAGSEIFSFCESGIGSHLDDIMLIPNFNNKK